MLGRISYLKELARVVNKHTVKVVTGIRGCGKSTLLEQFRKVLLSNKIDEKQIIFVSLDDSSKPEFRFKDRLLSYIESKLQTDGTNYIFIDDANRCCGFQDVVNSLFARSNTDIYISGSNSFAMTDSLKNIQMIDLLPLSFAEYVESQKQIKSYAELTLQQHFMDFAKFGNMPFTLQLFKNSMNIYHYLFMLYNTIIVQDIASVHPVKEIKVLDAAIRYILTNAGISCSSKKLSDTLTASGFKTTQPTAESYLNFMEECGLIYKVDRYDIKTREYLKSLPTFYAADVGLGNMLTRQPVMNPILRNLVFLELKRQGYKIYAGKIGTNTIDFVANKTNQTFYIQVEAIVSNTKLLNKKLRPFRQIKDFHPRVLISLDWTTGNTKNGIRFVNAIEFLQNGQI